jgi:predicted nucleic acid-binding protein
MPGEFLDTNVLVYAFTDDPRSARAQELLERGCVIGVQVLNEFTNVARRKLGMAWPEVADALSAIRVLCPTIEPMSLEIHEEAVAIAERHDLHIFDALIISAAMRSRCETLWSEDMHDGLIVDQRLSVRNPFGRS